MRPADSAGCSALLVTGLLGGGAGRRAPGTVCGPSPRLLSLTSQVPFSGRGGSGASPGPLLKAGPLPRQGPQFPSPAR